MRCRNCGWENDLGNSKCVKCNAPLSGPIIDDDKIVDENHDYNMLKRTVRENGFGMINEKSDNEIGTCIKCGYPYNSEMGACPNCGYDANNNNTSNINNNVKNNNIMGTVNPWIKPQFVEEVVNCTLTPVAWEGENIDTADIKFTGESVLLNRDNTEPNNNSITSKVQAMLTYEDEVWYIEDKSQMQTTFKHISRKTQLEDNEVILLGNRRFIFNKK